LLLRLWRAPKQLGAAVARQRLRRAGSRLTAGLIHMTEGDFKRGERLLTDGLGSSEARVVNYLMAARAAEAQGSPERRDEWLGLARDADPKAEVAVLLTQAELQVGAGEHQAARATLAEIESRKSGHAGALALLVEVCLQLGDERALAEVLPRLAKSKLDPDRLARLLVKALDSLRKNGDFGRDALKAVWSPLPVGLRRRPALIRARAQLLDRLGYGEEAVKSLASAIKRELDPALIRAYGEVKAADPSRQLARAENWLRQEPENAVLLTTVARLSMASELWGKARSYLESSLAIAPEPQTYALYGELLDRLGEREEAAQAYHAGLRLVAPQAEPLPALTALTWAPDAPDEPDASDASAAADAREADV
jgi:HemY protein